MLFIQVKANLKSTEDITVLANRLSRLKTELEKNHPDVKINIEVNMD